MIIIIIIIIIENTNKSMSYSPRISVLFILLYFTVN